MNREEVINFSKMILSGIGLILFGIGIFWLVGWILPGEEPYKQPKEIKLPSTEDVGKFAGKQSKSFVRGFIDGVFKKD